MLPLDFMRLVSGCGNMKIYAVKIEDICDENLHRLSLKTGNDVRKRIERFVYKEDKQRTLMGQILIREIIAQQLEMRNEDIVFQKNDYGKPYLENHEKFHFNISHSGDMVVCAVHDKPVGIDIEQMLHIDDYLEIAKDYFTEREIAYIAKNEDARLSRFYELWTLKESYIKCHGKGLSIPLKSFSIDIADEAVSVIVNGKRSNYLFKSFNIAPDYKVALCISDGVIPNDLIWVNQSELIKYALHE